MTLVAPESFSVKIRERNPRVASFQTEPILSLSDLSRIWR